MRSEAEVGLGAAVACTTNDSFGIFNKTVPPQKLRKVL